MRRALHDILNVCLSVIVAFFVVGKLCELHAAYELRVAKIEKEAWLRAECAKPDFYTHMRYHTNICEEVEATARIGAVMHAFNEVCNSSVPFVDTLLALAHRAGWGFFAAVAVAFLFFPSLFIYHRRAHQREDAYLPVHHKAL
jgi:hypothetical protein